MHETSVLDARRARTLRKRLRLNPRRKPRGANMSSSASTISQARSAYQPVVHRQGARWIA